MKIILEKKDVLNEIIHDNNGQVIGVRISFKNPVKLKKGDELSFPVELALLDNNVTDNVK
jgi:hypothetical protein